MMFFGLVFMTNASFLLITFTNFTFIMCIAGVSVVKLFNAVSFFGEDSHIFFFIVNCHFLLG